ncbi:MAG: 6-hydroxycyclohex-1-ene-1-carbonyl-CoA dehydrogenase, partial [Planctomycetota bacterium]|nr:6-hydroxycyclohex-1-ene-1-carbonyl-CoA dehydrogenase [Planctomycetota bacterium]
MRVDGWMVNAPGEPMVLTTRDEVVGSGEALIEVAGSGVCHTDLGFYYDGIPTRHPYPLTLGHEVSGRVVAAGIGCEAWEGRGVVVPAVIPCGRCPACATGRGAVCPEQIFPGNDVHGGFASHLKVPVTGLCEVPDLTDAHHNPHDLDLASLSVIADAVTTPYQAIERSGLGNGDLAIFVGAGGVGGFGVQIAATRAASVIAIDVDAGRLELVNEHGADLVLNSAELDFRELRKEIRHFAAEREIPTWRQRIFETSGTAAGQTTAFGLLEHGGYLSVVGFTKDKVNVRLSNLMAFHATVEGNWGCLPEHYPAVLALVLSGQVQLEPFVERRFMSSINQT